MKANYYDIELDVIDTITGLVLDSVGYSGSHTSEYRAKLAAKRIWEKELKQQMYFQYMEKYGLDFCSFDKMLKDGVIIFRNTKQTRIRNIKVIRENLDYNSDDIIHQL